MDHLLSLLPSVEKGILPYYLFVISIVSIGNSLQNLATLHYTRRIYNGKFVKNTSRSASASSAADPEDSTAKVVPATPGKDDAKAEDQVSPLAARLFGTYTFMAGLIRFYASYDLGNRSLYQLALWTHVIAAVHFTSEMLAFKTIRFSGPQIFPFLAGYGGAVWMILQYKNYVVG
ncbi:hypothetical protein VTK73DRAFT_1377 [Phialemonium thermophilum]|uniref:Ergosterol biosynthetic protein 28 n=1 Tax=Phialemonium thermophilum TaxID=223376 RepID=A0ABR3XAK9_9PEZI